MLHVVIMQNLASVKLQSFVETDLIFNSPPRDYDKASAVLRPTPIPFY